MTFVDAAVAALDLVPAAVYGALVFSWRIRHAWLALAVAAAGLADLGFAGTHPLEPSSVRLARAAAYFLLASTGLAVAYAIGRARAARRSRSDRGARRSGG